MKENISENQARRKSVNISENQGRRRSINISENQARKSLNSLNTFNKNVNDDVKPVKEISTKDIEAECTDSQKQLLLSR